MQDDRLNMIVGLVLLPLIVGAVVAVLVIGDRPLRPSLHFQVEFDYVGQLRPGAKVKMANMVIGRVKHLSFKEKVVQGKRVRRVRAHLWIYTRHRNQVWQNSEAFISSASLIGERHLELAAPEGAPGRLIRRGDVIQGKSPSYLDRFLWMGYKNLVATQDLMDAVRPHYRKLETYLDKVIAEIEHLQGHEKRVRTLVKRAEAVVDDFKRSYKTLQASTDDFRALTRLEQRITRFGRRAKAGTKPLIAQVERLIDLVDALAKVMKQRVPPAIDTITARADRMTKRFKLIQAYLKIVERSLSRGTGTIGAFMKERELFDDFKSSGKVIRQQIWRNITRPKKTSVKGHPALP